MKQISKHWQLAATVTAGMLTATALLSVAELLDRDRTYQTAETTKVERSWRDKVSYADVNELKKSQPKPVAPATQSEPGRASSSQGYDPVKMSMFNAAKNVLKRCEQENDQSDVFGWAACEKQRELVEYARSTL